MRLGKLLLGSAAAVMAAGLGSAPVKAADVSDMNGLVTTMANYLESCQNGNGIQFAVTCMWITGEVEFEIQHGREIVWGGDEFNDDAIPEGNYCLSQFPGDDPLTVPDPDAACDVGDTIHYFAGQAATANPDYGTPAGNYNQQVDDNGLLTVDFDPELHFAWSIPGYDVEISFPLTTPNDVEVDISKPGGWSLHLERPGLGGNSVIFSIPFNAFTVTLGADFDGGDPDLDLDIDAEFGNVEIGFGVHSDDWSDPTFDADIGFDIGGWGLTVYGATTGWGAGNWEPNIDVVLGGDLGPVSLDLFFGYEDRADDNWAIAAEAGVDVAGMTVTAGVLRSIGTTSNWGYFTDDYGRFPYDLDPDELMWAFWGGIAREWSSEHESEFTVFFSESPDIPDSENLRLEFVHTWTPVGGNVEVEGTVWYANDFGGAADPVWGMGLTTTIPLFPG